LEVNGERTKYMVLCRDVNAEQNHTLRQVIQTSLAMVFFPTVFLGTLNRYVAQ